MSSSTLGSIVVDLKANTTAFVEGMSAASSAARKVGKDLEGSFANIGNLAQTALAPLGELGGRIGEVFAQVGVFGASAAQGLASLSGGMSGFAIAGGVAAGAVAAVAGGAIALAAHTAETAAKLYEQAQAAGVSVEALSGLGFVAQQAGVDQDTLTKGLEKMSKAVYTAAQAPAGAKNAFTQLGVAIKDVNGQILPTKTIFENLAAKFAAMPDGVQKTALAIQIFGKAGAGLIPVLNEGKAGVEEWLATAQKLGIVISTDTAQRAHEFEQQLNVLKAAGQGFSLSLMQQMLPALQAVTKELTNTASASSQAARSLAGFTVGLATALLGVPEEFSYIALQLGTQVQGWAGLVRDAAVLIGTLLTDALNPFKRGHLEDDWKAGIQRLLDNYRNFANQLHLNAAQHQSFLADLYGDNATAVPPKPSGGPDQDDDSNEKLRSAVDKVVNSLREQIATLGQDKLSITEYQLAQQGATTADIQQIEKLNLKLSLLKDEVTRQKEAAAAAKERAAVQLDATLKKEKDGIDASIAATDQLGKTTVDFGVKGLGAFHGVDQAVADLTKSLQDQIANFGKSDQQLQLAALQAQGATAEQIAQIQKLEAELSKMQDQAGKISQVWKSFENDVSRGLVDAIAKGQSFTQVLKGIVDQLAEMLLKIALFGKNGKGGLLGGLFSSIGGFFGGFLAGGGSVAPGSAYVVGESGPEMFVPDSPGNIISNSQSFGGGSTNVTYNVDARGASPGVHADIVRALRASEDRAVYRAIAMQQQLALRSPTVPTWP